MTFVNMHTKFRQECALNISKYADDDEWCGLSNNWLKKAFLNKYMYNYEFLGRPIIQLPSDMVQIQELIWQTKPDLIIETGIAHGGSLIMSAAMLALLDLSEAIENGDSFDPKLSKRKVLGIDIDIRSHNHTEIENHPMSSRIEMIQGSSVSSNVLEQVNDIARNYERIMVCLDSNHTHSHVLKELELYADFTSIGCYCIVFDTIVEDLGEGMFPGRPWGPGDNPKTAVWEFQKNHPEFEIDKHIENKLLVTVAPDGYMKRVA